MAKKRKLRSSDAESQPSNPQQITLHYVPVEYQPPDDQTPDLENQQPEQQQNQEQEQQIQQEEEIKEELEEEAEKQQHEEEEKQQEQEEEEYVEEPVEKLLEPLAKEQLVLLLKEAVTNHPDLIQIIHKLADTDPAHRKIFVHGLGYDTTAETLISFFSSYGEIEDCKAVVDKISGKSKGYAFILFKNRSGARNALKSPQKTIGNRTASCQLASEGPVSNATSAAATSAASNLPVVSEYTQRKIFVSNVSADLDPKRLVEFFSQFGEIEEGPLGIDKQTGRFKGFCLFVYRSVEGAKKALEEPHKPLDGTTLHCKKAVDGPIHSKAPHQHNFRREKRPYPGQGGGHMMAPPQPHMGPNLGPDLAPVIGQALTALLANQGGNLLSGFGGAQQGMNNNQGYNNQGYNQQYGVGGYGAPRPQGGGYQNQQMGGGPYMGHNR